MRHQFDLPSDYSQFEVTCKIAIFNPDRTSLLLATYDDGLYGLPGGHLEPHESPDAAARRELAEELALTPTHPLHPVTFGFHPEKQKVILLFATTLADDTPLPPAPPNSEHLTGSRWVALADIRADQKNLYLDAHYRQLLFSIEEKS